MTREMEQIKVETTKDGMILISQDEPYSDVGSVVVISPDQVDTLCKWLKEERDKLKKRE